tara:strand:- start:1790 stop:4591 length:2802 start_codon:yes stop_codon:yes gene_type:complete
MATKNFNLAKLARNINIEDDGSIAFTSEVSAGGETIGSLTASMDSNQTSTITLSKASTPVPIVQAYKEIPQTGVSSKGQWNVNANATNYDFYDEKPISYASTTLTPSATGDGTFTLSSGSFDSADVGKKVVGNSGSAIITATSGTYTSVTAFADTSAISSWQLFGAQGKSDGSGIELTSIGGGYDFANLSYTGRSFYLTGAVATLTSAEGMSMKPDGTKIWVLDRASDKIVEFSLSTPYEIDTASSTGTTLNILSYESAGTGIHVNSEGTRLIIIGSNQDEWNEFHLSTGWDLTTATHDQVTSIVSITSGVGAPQDLVFNDDGTRMFIVGANTDKIFGYTLSTAFDISTLTSAGELSIASIDGTPGALSINNDGTELYISGTQYDNLQMLKLDTAYDLSSYNASESLTYDWTSDGTGIGTTAVEGITISKDGTKLYLTAGNEYIYEYDFGAVGASNFNSYSPALTNSSNGQINSASWLDISSMTADETKNAGDIFYAVSTDNRTSWSIAKASDGVRKIARNNSGTWQYNNGAVVPPAGYQIPASFRTGHSSSLTVTTSDIGLSASEEMIIRTPVISDNGTKLTWMNRQGNEPYIVQYDLSTPYDISTGTFSYKHDMNYSGSFNYETWCFNTTGTKIYITGSISSTVSWIEHTLSTAWDLSTASYTRTETYTPAIAYREDFIVAATNDNLYTITEQNDQGKVWSVTNGDISTATVTTTVHPMTNNYMFQPSLSMDGTKLAYTELNDRGDVYIETLATPFDFSSSTGVTQVLSTDNTDLNKTIAYSDDGLYAVKGDAVNVTGDKVLYAYSTGTTASGSWVETDSDWTNGTYNNEHATLQQALTSQATNRMNKAQLDAVADGYHFSQDSADTLDLMIAPYATSGVSPISDGVTINYDAASKYRQAVPETDYRVDFAGTSTVEFTSNISANFKVKVV